MNYNILTQALPQDVDGVVFDVESLSLRLLRLTDQRKRRGRRYALAVVVLVLLLAKLAGQDTPAGIADWVQWRRELFVNLFQLKRPQMPHAATYRRVLTHSVTLAELERELSAFRMRAPGAGQSERVTLDGKKLRGVVPLENGRGTYLLAVFLPTEGLVLCQVAVDDKSNEIPAAQEALKHLKLRDSSTPTGIEKSAHLI